MDAHGLGACTARSVRHFTLGWALPCLGGPEGTEDFHAREHLWFL